MAQAQNGEMPERFGPWSTVFQRFRDWRNQGTFNQILKRLRVKLNAQGLIDLGTWCSKITDQATWTSSGAGKTGGEAPADHALGRSRGGLTPKIHMACEGRGLPLRLILYDEQGQSYECLLLAVCSPSRQAAIGHKQSVNVRADVGNKWP